MPERYFPTCVHFTLWSISNADLIFPDSLSVTWHRMTSAFCSLTPSEPILQYSNTANSAIQQYSQFYITAIQPILQYSNTANSALQQLVKMCQILLQGTVCTLYIHHNNSCVAFSSEFYLLGALYILHIYKFSHNLHTMRGCTDIAWSVLSHPILC